MEERKKRKREQANESDRSADSIVEEVIEMIKDQGGKNDDEEIPLPEIPPALSESSTSSDVSTTSYDSTTKSPLSNSSKSSSEETCSKSVSESKDEEKAEEPCVGPDKKKKSPKIAFKANKRKPIAKPFSDSEEGEMEDDSDSDVPLSKARAKRKRRTPKKLDNSFSGSEFDDSGGEGPVSPRLKRAKRVSKKGKNKVKIVGKKVTETWCIEKEKVASVKNTKKRKAEEVARGAALADPSDSEEEEDIPVSKKGKSSSKRPPKNSHIKYYDRPKRAQKISYVEDDEEFLF